MDHVRIEWRSFVGRRRELDILRAVVDGAVAGRGGLALLAGEPGIGKTRLAEEAAAYGRSRGAAVVWGRCWEGDGAPAFWPWISVLRWLVGRTALDTLGANGSVIGRLLPEVGGQAVGISGDERFRLFDAISMVLRQAAMREPIVLVLDDLQWSDAPSLLLLRFLTREIRESPVVIIGTYRDMELVEGHPLSALLGELVGACQHVLLSGLAQAEVAELAQSLMGDLPTSGIDVALYRATGGNPYFVRELIYSHADQHWPLVVPGGVRAVINRRVGMLSPECAGLLESAAVLGQECDLDILSTVVGLSVDKTTQLADEAVTARLAELGDDPPSRVRFGHALVRQTLYARLSPGRRAELHARAAEAIEERRQGQLEPRLGELAEHLWQAGIDPARAADYASRAGQRALTMLAYEEAVRHFARAVQIMDATNPAAVEARCRLTLLLGRAQYLAANVSEARATYRSAADLAEQIKAAELLAEAALAVGVDYTFGIRDDLEIQLLESALRHLPERHEALQARVLARLARALLFGSDLPYRMRLSEQAVVLARRSGDTTALAAVLIDRHIAVWGFANAPERLEIATEVVRLAQASEDRGLLIQGHVLRLANLLELVDIAGYNAEVDVYEQLVRDNRLEHLTWHVLLLRANQHFITGRFPEAEELIDAALAMGHRVEHPSVEVWCAALFTSVKLWRGQAEEAITWLRSQADKLPAVPAARSGVAVLLADSGQTAAARIEFERLAADDFGHLPRDETWLINMGALAATCHVLEDRPRAAALYDLMLPYGPYLTRFNHAGAGCSAPISWHLGLLALTLERFDIAEDHLTVAISVSERMGAPVFAANARIKLAECLEARGRPEDTGRASTARQNAEEIMRALQIRPICLRAATSYRDVPVAALRRAGEYWMLSYAGHTTHIKDSVGLHHLARLLSAPGQEIHALDLAAGPTGRTQPPGSGLGPVLDDNAKAAYRTRLSELSEELTEAESFGDRGRAELARGEIDALTEQLTAAYGLGGRDRQVGSDIERARTAVTKTIRSAIKRIAAQHPRLGDHLSHAVRTGTYCSYTPDPTASITWTL